MREQADLLDHIADAAAQPDRVPLYRWLALDAHHAGSRVKQTIDQLHRRRFSRAAAAEQHQGLALIHFQAQGGEQCASVRQGEADAAKLDGGLAVIHDCFFSAAGGVPRASPWHLPKHPWGKILSQSPGQGRGSSRRVATQRFFFYSLFTHETRKLAENIRRRAHLPLAQRSPRNLVLGRRGSRLGAGLVYPDHALGPAALARSLPFV